MEANDDDEDGEEEGGGEGSGMRRRGMKEMKVMGKDDQRLDDDDDGHPRSVESSPERDFCWNGRTRNGRSVSALATDCDFLLVGDGWMRRRISWKIP